MKFATVTISALLVSAVQAIKYGTRDQDVKSLSTSTTIFTGGNPFDDTDALGPDVISNMKEVIVIHNERIDGLQTKFDQKNAPAEISHGTTNDGNGRKVTPIDVRTDPITKVNIRQTDRVVGMDLVQRSGKVTVVGSKNGDSTPIEPPEPNMGLIGFHGRAGQEIDSLGFIWGKELPEQ